VIRFVAAVRAEFAKVFTTRMWWILAIVLFAYIALIAGGLGALFGGISTGKISPSGGGGGGRIPDFGSLAPLIYSFATSVGYVFPVLLGALATTGEFRHQTLTPTFLTNPRREQVLGAKSLSSLAVGAGYGIVALLASVGAGSLALYLFGVDTALGDADTWAMFARALVTMALWAAIGVGLGTIVPNQTAAIVIILAFTQFLEPLLRLAASFSDVTASIGKFLPGASSDALVGSSFFTVSNPATQSLDWWQGGLVLLGYAILFTVVGYFSTWRKDVT
jgi:ABC-2 type transport system permease protein